MGIISFFYGWKWGVLVGIEEVVKFFEGFFVNVYVMFEGMIFYFYELVL